MVVGGLFGDCLGVDWGVFGGCLGVVRELSGEGLVVVLVSFYC